MKQPTAACLPLILLFATANAAWAQAPGSPALEKSFRELPVEARSWVGPLFWMHGNARETPQRLQSYIARVAEGGNGCFTAESRPHEDWLGPKWYADLGVCLEAAKSHQLQMWIFDERWWPSQGVGGKVPAAYAAKSLVAESMDASRPGPFEATGFAGPNHIATLAGELTTDNRIIGSSLIDLSPFIKDGNLSWTPPRGRWRVMHFSHRTAPGLAQSGGKQLSVDGASRDCVEWFLKTVYQPHYDHFKDDFGKTIRGFFYDEPETLGDWGTELDGVLRERGVDWMKAYVAYKFQLEGDEDAAARYQYMDAFAETWGRTMYGGMTRWCRERGVKSIGHMMEHKYLYVHPSYCAGDMMLLQKYSDMGAIDMVCSQMPMGQRPLTIYQTPKLASSISHVYGKQDDLAMCEIFGGYGQQLTYPTMKWLTDQHQVRGVNFMIPHAFNPQAPYDRDYPPYFYNDGHEPRWPLYRVWADYTSRLSLWLTGGHHVCPVAILFSGNTRRVGDLTTPEDLTTALQDALYDCDWLPFDAFEHDATLNGPAIALHGERYRALILPAAEFITLPVLTKAKAFHDQGGVVIGYGRLPSKSATIDASSEQIREITRAIWGDNPAPGTAVCSRSAAGGRAYFLPEKPDAAMLQAVLHQDAGIAPVVEVLSGNTEGWLHVLHRVKDGTDVYLICNQQSEGEAKDFTLRVQGRGAVELWDPMRNEILSLPCRQVDDSVEFPLTLEPLESALIVLRESARKLPARLTRERLAAARTIDVKGSALESTPPPVAPAENGKLTLSPVKARPFEGTFEIPGDLALPATRIYLDMEQIEPEAAARVTLNGADAGGVIGKPLRLEVSRWLKPGTNTLRIEPFAPAKVRLLVAP